ncbi:S-adenosyl-L-methionine-dependent methyltransferase [Xylariales sp. PMI_506]|nr:S-adenosyl-L-methionine-dependent methyltransferase [Xylariales sp. PMI_506]
MVTATTTATPSAQTSVRRSSTATDNVLEPPKPAEVKDSEEVLYTPWRLAFYDFWVLGLVTTYGWCCPTTTYLLPLFRANVRKNHLDIGVGSGYYLDPSTVPTTTKLTLIDSESHALAVAKARTKRSDATAIVANVLEPLPLSEKYDSVSMYYLLHCIPVSIEQKCRVFSNIKLHMTPDGVLTGANILNKGVKQDNFFGAWIRRGITRHGILHNASDTAYDFEHALRENFHKVETWVVGSIFIFRAESPKV